MLPAVRKYHVMQDDGGGSGVLSPVGDGRAGVELARVSGASGARGDEEAARAARLSHETSCSEDAASLSQPPSPQTPTAPGLGVPVRAPAAAEELAEDAPVDEAAPVARSGAAT